MSRSYSGGMGRSGACRTPRRLAVAAGIVALALSASAAAAHEPIRFDIHRATPGVRLEIVELGPLTANSTAARFRLHAFGLPRDTVFAVWVKEFGHYFHEVASGIHVDSAGVLVSSERSEAGRPMRLDEMTFEPGPYPAGAAWEVALVSTDRTVTAFAKVIPRPITARDGRCTVSLELATRHGDRFIAAGSGFLPDEDLIVESEYSGRTTHKALQASTEGRLPEDFLLHEGKIDDADHHARYTVKGQSCKVVLEYEWGESALDRR